MAGIKSKNTKPELVIRRALHGLGVRYSLHNKNIAGKPDLFMRKHKAAIFVNGCFWHGHDCKFSRVPSTNQEFWVAKILINQIRDSKVLKSLKDLGIRVAIVWECDLRGKTSEHVQLIANGLRQWLNDPACQDYREHSQDAIAEHLGED